MPAYSYATANASAALVLRDASGSDLLETLLRDPPGCVRCLLPPANPHSMCTIRCSRAQDRARLRLKTPLQGSSKETLADSTGRRGTTSNDVACMLTHTKPHQASSFGSCIVSQSCQQVQQVQQNPFGKDAFRDSSATAVQRSGQLVFGDNTVSVRVQLFKVDLHPGGTCTNIALLAGNVDVTKASANLEFCASSTNTNQHMSINPWTHSSLSRPPAISLTRPLRGHHRHHRSS